MNVGMAYAIEAVDLTELSSAIRIYSSLNASTHSFPPCSTQNDLGILADPHKYKQESVDDRTPWCRNLRVGCSTLSPNENVKNQLLVDHSATAALRRYR